MSVQTYLLHPIYILQICNERAVGYSLSAEAEGMREMCFAALSHLPLRGVYSMDQGVNSKTSPTMFNFHTHLRHMASSAMQLARGLDLLCPLKMHVYFSHRIRVILRY